MIFFINRQQLVLKEKAAYVSGLIVSNGWKPSDFTGMRALIETANYAYLNYTINVRGSARGFLSLFPGNKYYNFRSEAAAAIKAADNRLDTIKKTVCKRAPNTAPSVPMAAVAPIPAPINPTEYVPVLHKPKPASDMPLSQQRFRGCIK